MKISKFILACATVACLGAYSITPAQAAVITILNYSFENATGYWAEANAPSSWTGAGSNLTAGGSWNASVGLIGSITGGDGSNMLNVHVDTGTDKTVSGSGWVYTNSLGTYAANTVYSLTVAVASNSNYDHLLNSIIALGSDGTTPGSAWASTTTAFQDITLTLDTSVVTSAVGKSIVVLLEHNATAGTQNGQNLFYDNVRLTSAVPEPATWALLAFSLTSVMVFRRRRNS
jgi:hypothetical protein